MIRQECANVLPVIEDAQLDIFLCLNREIYCQEDIGISEICLDNDGQLCVSTAMRYVDNLARYYRKAATINQIDNYHRSRYFSFTLKLANHENSVEFEMLLSHIKQLYKTINHLNLNQLLFYDKSYVHEYEMYSLSNMICVRSYSYYEKEREIVFKVPVEAFKSNFLKRFELLKTLLNAISKKLDIYPW